jgi:hypothetical protein
MFFDDDPVPVTVLAGVVGHRSVMWPIPAYSRTSLIPATADGLSGKERETATTVPSGAVILNLKPASSSLKSSNIPTIGLLPAVTAALASIVCHSARERALGCRPDGLVKAWIRVAQNVKQATRPPLKLCGKSGTGQ